MERPLGVGEDAAEAFGTALEFCRLIKENTEAPILVRLLEVRVLWALGRREEGLSHWREIRHGRHPASYNYNPDDYAVDTLTFDVAADLSLQGASLLFDLPVPEIYNVSPDSHLGLFPKIGIDECLEMLVDEPSAGTA